MRVYGEEITAYSTWTTEQWANCFPVQKRLLWAYPPTSTEAAP